MSRSAAAPLRALALVGAACTLSGTDRAWAQSDEAVSLPGTDAAVTKSETMSIDYSTGKPFRDLQDQIASERDAKESCDRSHSPSNLRSFDGQMIIIERHLKNAKFDQARIMVNKSIDLISADGETSQHCPSELKWLFGLRNAIDGKEVDLWNLFGRGYGNKRTARISKLIYWAYFKVHNDISAVNALTFYYRNIDYADYSKLDKASERIFVIDSMFEILGFSGANTNSKRSFLFEDYVKDTIRRTEILEKVALKIEFNRMYELYSDYLRLNGSFTNLFKITGEWSNFAKEAFPRSGEHQFIIGLYKVESLNYLGNAKSAANELEVLSKISISGRQGEFQSQYNFNLAMSIFNAGNVDEASSIFRQIIERAVKSPYEIDVLYATEAARRLIEIYYLNDNYAKIQETAQLIFSLNKLSELYNKFKISEISYLANVNTKSYIEFRIESNLAVIDAANEFSKLANRLESNNDLEGYDFYGGGQFRRFRNLFNANNSDSIYYMRLLALDAIKDAMESKTYYQFHSAMQSGCRQMQRSLERIDRNEGVESINYIKLLGNVAECRAIADENFWKSVGSTEHTIGDVFERIESRIESIRLQRGAEFSEYAYGDFRRQLIDDGVIFQSYLDLNWILRRVPGSRAVEDDQVFLAMQDKMLGSSSFAVAIAVSRKIGAKDGVSGLIEQRGEIVADLILLRSQIMASLADTSDAAVQNRTELASRRDVAFSRLQVIDEDLRSRSPSYFEALQARSLPVAEAQGLLGDDEAVLIVVPSEFGTHVMALTKTALVWNRADIKANEARSQPGRGRARPRCRVGCPPRV